MLKFIICFPELLFLITLPHLQFFQSRISCSIKACFINWSRDLRWNRFLGTSMQFILIRCITKCTIAQILESRYILFSHKIIERLKILCTTTYHTPSNGSYSSSSASSKSKSKSLQIADSINAITTT